MKHPPKVLIFSGYGLNCEEETAHAFTLSGADPSIIHLNTLIETPKKINDFQIMVFPGGFSFGDDTGSGRAYANRVRNHLWSEIQKFILRDTLTLGICNGFQIMTNLGLLPATEKKYGDVQVSLVHNSFPRYLDRWVDLKIASDSPWLKKNSTFSLPIAHGEGRFFASDQLVKILRDQKQIALKYVFGETSEFFSQVSNPNGSIDDIAGITDPTGRIFGLMPHPERAMYFTQLPHWTQLKDKLKREGKEIPKFGPGIKIFQNGVKYFE